MNHYGKLFTRLGGICAVISALVPGISMATTVTATVSARVVPALNADVKNGLEFGEFSAGAGGGTIIVGANGNQRYGNGNVALRGASTAQPAKFLVTGQKNAAYTVNVPSNIILSDNNGHQMAINRLLLSDNAGKLDHTGQQELRIGGSLQVGSEQPVGLYQGMMSVSLDYN